MKSETMHFKDITMIVVSKCGSSTYNETNIGGHLLILLDAPRCLSFSLMVHWY